MALSAIYQLYLGKLHHLWLRVECTLFCNLQSQVQTHAVLVYELLGNPTTKLIEPPYKLIELPYKLIEPPYKLIELPYKLIEPPYKLIGAFFLNQKPIQNVY
jgi:hypothetical protein